MHFEYIDKGLALEAPDGMYNLNEKQLWQQLKKYKETLSVSAHDTYSCARPKNINTMDCCRTCTSRQPNISCKFLKIETIYIKD